MKLVRLTLILSLVTVLGIFSTSSTPYVEADYDIPDWVETLAGMWFSGGIDDDSFGNALDWLIDNEILTTPNTPTNSSLQSAFTNSTGTYNVILSGTPFTNSTGTYQLMKNISGEGIWLWHMNTSVFTNSTGTYMQTPSGTYMIYQ